MKQQHCVMDAFLELNGWYKSCDCHFYYWQWLYVWDSKTKQLRVSWEHPEANNHSLLQCLHVDKAINGYIIVSSLFQEIANWFLCFIWTNYFTIVVSNRDHSTMSSVEFFFNIKVELIMKLLLISWIMTQFLFKIFKCIFLISLKIDVTFDIKKERLTKFYYMYITL